MDPLQPWHWRSYALEDRSGSIIFDALFRHQKIATLLESPAPSLLSQHPCLPQCRYSICAGAPRTISGQLQLWTPPVGQILTCLHQLLSRQSSAVAPTSTPADLPFLGGWLGWLGYDLAWEIECLPWLRPDSLPFPTAYWYEPDSFAVLDHHQQQLWLAASNVSQLDVLEQQLCSPHGQGHHLSTNLTPALDSEPQITYLTSQSDYEALVRRAQRHIQAGDIFQANLSLRFTVHSTTDPWALYRNLHHINPSPFASYWQTPWGTVVSCSPERLVQLRDQQAQTRPIAGTRSRGTTPEQDQKQAQNLLTNTKEKAEHTMLVDLERNDLGRVCTWGSVEVSELLVLEYYSHVVHLVSNVVGTVSPRCSPVDLIRAMFPGGTITGCPKVRCMEIIERLEPFRRSLFYGSCGYLDYRGHLDLNILIRTLLVTPDPQTIPVQNFARPQSQPNVVWGQVGAGIVADSLPEQEWYESLQKAQAQLAALQTHIPPMHRSFD